MKPTRRRTAALSFTIAAALLLEGLVLAAPGTSPPANMAVPVKQCSDEDEGHWLFVREAQLGVQAHASSSHEGWVGRTAATDGFHDWAPLDAYKTTMCGQLGNFDTFEPNREIELLQFLPEIPEHDWNILLIPSPPVFAERFQLASWLMERGHENDLELCSDQPLPCFEAEVTPPRRLLKANVAGRWLSSCRRGQHLCAFGPWVGDGGHGYRPEIHPAERIWWRDGDRLRLLFVQDASQRFRDHRQFQWKGGGSEGSYWQPWATPALEGEFRIAFELLKGSSVDFLIEQSLDGNARQVSPHLQDLSPHFPLEKSGTPVGRVNVRLGLGSRADRNKLDLSTLDFAVVEACERLNGTLQGYLKLHDSVGYRFEGGEGFNTFEVTPPPFLPVGNSPPDLKAPPCQLEEVTVHEPLDTLRASVLIAATEKNHRRLSPAVQEKVLPDLLRAAMPERPHEMIQTFQRERPPVEIGSTGLITLLAQPHYDGPRADRLQKAIEDGNRNNFHDLLAAVSAPIPHKVEWKLDLHDVTTGADLSSDRFEFHCKGRLLEGDDCSLKVFPSDPDDVVQVTVTARLLFVDSEGHATDEVPISKGGGTAPGHAQPPRTEVTTRLATHVILTHQADSADKLLSWLSKSFPPAAGDSLEVLALLRIDAVPTCNDLASYRRLFHARMLRHGLALASTHGWITSDELTRFVRIAKDFSSVK